MDDNNKNRKLCRALLAPLEYAVLEAEDGAQAVEAARRELPDLILMDIQMPVMDGEEAAQILRADGATRDIPIVALTSYAMKGDREKFLASGFADYISKPINIDGFLEVIRRCLGTR